LFLFFLFSETVFGQEKQYTTTDREALKLFSSANQKLSENLYDDAIIQLQKAIAADGKFVGAHILLGDIYRRQYKHNPAIEQYLRVIALNPEFNRSVYLKIGDEEINEGQYREALRHLQKYLAYPDIAAQSKLNAQKLVADCVFSIHAIANPVLFKPVNLGPAINTGDDEYLPVTTADESTLIFTRKTNNNEDFYKSDKADGKWQTAVYLSDQINTSEYNEGAQSVSQDGNFLFFTGCNRPDGLGRCDIYIAQKKGTDWVKPFDLSPPVNTPGWEAQPAISADGRTLYFVSNRPGGYGGYDIWKSKLTAKGWGEPENLGPNINTQFDEQSPFIHPDDSTLYFCSNGWPGLGGKDLFVSRLGRDGKWKKPENLGYPINTNGDESGLTVTADGEHAFFSSNKLEGYGGYDIYNFELPPADRPQIVTYVKGAVRDAKTKAPLEAAVEIIDLIRDSIVYRNYSTAEGGNFLATLIAGKNYGLNISKPGYLFYSENFSLLGYQDKKAFELVVSLEPIEIGGKVILNNIFFDTNQYNLKPESVAELEKLLQFLKTNPTLHIEISGHTDDVGNAQLNQTLSENRAKSVYQYLVHQKINPARLVYKGYGKTQPIAGNTSDEGRKKNRRTEFKIIEK
jgi:outer membrane protein OmpA-like peptidoglycan-associated protein